MDGAAGGDRSKNRVILYSSGTVYCVSFIATVSVFLYLYSTDKGKKRKLSLSGRSLEHSDHKYNFIRFGGIHIDIIATIFYFERL